MTKLKLEFFIEPIVIELIGMVSQMFYYHDLFLTRI